ncbi:hypothetical protein COU78_02700 [Candidatus Peregrinibacteria bacterium CG10_big_fil_rev_8_21_14_0_10_49_24]|nr:MAG: hypothetical protein COV83_02680 [Candidatus Peregrinibacteria bacterium CG11_big_fil_rev_8_21_14_0_20_49_14]PIR51046.1 MAG: hypothetical protein COU78_02700 [Candidatus Peregrinibacteria bacterium CG10_big_fil_rev_8_21_14_0_10_49_24]PJA67599.1 MAG: hypothetical protein CO157_04180 [Candidatus Peregrinibacteria bacterium CG_4_9_14_3_um_filter_49_12]
MRIHNRCIASFAISVLVLGIVPQYLHAAQATGTITIEQQSPNGIIGEWILIKPGNKRTVLRQKTYTFDEAEVGNYTILIEPPAGSETTIRTFIEQDLLKSVKQPQTSFMVEQNSHILVRIEYVFTRVGKVGVNSQPPGVEFTLKGPNKFAVQSVTPQSYNDMPEGQYTVEYQEIPDCPKANLISDKLIVGGRINFNVNFECEGIKNIKQQQEYEKTLEFITTEIDGKKITFSDVPTREWFAPFVSNALKTGIMTGYRDERGTVTGEYGPGNDVTIAELAKIAHKIANVDENLTRSRTVNLRAHGTWFEQYFASAENLEWLVFQDHRIDPGRAATRGEVVATLLQALDIPRNWGKGNVFTDVYRRTQYGSSIETAAADGIVDGFRDPDGKPTGEFRPDKAVNRAEMAKIIKNAIDIYLGGKLS